MKNFSSKHFNISRPSLCYLGLALGARIFSSTANASFLLLAGYALLGRAQAIQALLLSWLFTMISPGIAAEATGGAVGRYAVLASAALSVFVRSGIFREGFKLKPLTIATLLLGTFFIVHALFFSPIKDVSVLKAVSWTLAVSTLFAAWSKLSQRESERLERQIFSTLTVVALASLPLLILPTGYLRNGTGFQGILNHPQAFGITMALLGAWAASRLLSEKRPTWTMIALTTLCLGLILLSEARTAGVALMLGVGLSTFIAPRLAGRSTKSVLPGLRSKRLILILGLTLSMLALTADKVENKVSTYLSKSGRSETATLLAAYESSRGNLIDAMWLNVTKHPLTGIGFGIASDPNEMVITRDPLFGLPTNAPIEKGVLPLAVWEEIGLIGLIAFLAWFFALLKIGARTGLAPVAIGLTVLLLNMGESMLFSPGGMGLLILIVIGWAISKKSDLQFKR